LRLEKVTKRESSFLKINRAVRAYKSNALLTAAGIFAKEQILINLKFCCFWAFS